MRYPKLSFFQFTYLLTLIFATVFVLNPETRDFGYTVYFILGVIPAIRFIFLFFEDAK